MPATGMPADTRDRSLDAAPVDANPASPAQSSEKELDASRLTHLVGYASSRAAVQHMLAPITAGGKHVQIIVPDWLEQA